MTATLHTKRKLTISIVLMVVLLVLATCKPIPSPTPTSLPTLTATPTLTPAELDQIQLSPELQLYLERMRPVASMEAIFTARDKTSAELLAIAAEMKLLVPPPGLEEAHATLVEGYEFLAEGTGILEGRPDPELRAEGIFMQG